MSDVSVFKRTVSRQVIKKVGERPLPVLPPGSPRHYRSCRFYFTTAQWFCQTGGLHPREPCLGPDRSGRELLFAVRHPRSADPAAGEIATSGNSSSVPQCMQTASCEHHDPMAARALTAQLLAVVAIEDRGQQTDERDTERDQKPDPETAALDRVPTSPPQGRSTAGSQPVRARNRTSAASPQKSVFTAQRAATMRTATTATIQKTAGHDGEDEVDRQGGDHHQNNRSHTPSGEGRLT